MKILVVTHYFWPEEFRINDLARVWKDRGHDVTVLAPMPNYPKGVRFPGYHFFTPRRQTDQGIEIVRVPILTRGKKKQGWRLALSYFSAALFASVLGPLYCRGRFDVIFVYQPSPVTTAIPAIILKKFKHVPLMLWVQDLWPESIVATGFVHSSIILASVRKVVKWIYRHCDKILVQSKGFIKPVIAQGGEAARITYFPNWAEDLYKPRNPDQHDSEYAELPKGFLVMFAGNLGIAQDFPTILGAAELVKDIPDVRWVILGDGSMRGWIEEEVRKRGLEKSVCLLGRNPMESMPRFFSHADVLLVTLKRDPIFALTIPGKVQSYLACGKPIVAALDGEGAKVIEESGAGIACPSENHEALALAIRKMVSMPVEEREKMGQQGLQYYKKYFDRVTLIGQLESWMRDLLKK